MSNECIVKTLVTCINVHTSTCVHNHKKTSYQERDEYKKSDPKAALLERGKAYLPFFALPSCFSGVFSFSTAS